MNCTTRLHGLLRKVAVAVTLVISARVVAADDLSSPSKSAGVFANALSAGDSAKVRQVVTASGAELLVLDKIANYFKAIADLKTASAKLPGDFPTELTLSPDLASLYAHEKEQINGGSATLSTVLEAFGQGNPTFVKRTDHWVMDVKATVQDDDRLSDLGRLCEDSTAACAAAKAKVQAGAVTSMNNLLTASARENAAEANSQIKMIFAGAIPGMPGGMGPGAAAGTPGGGGLAGPDADARARALLDALTKNGAPPGAMDRAVTANTPPPAHGVGFDVPTAGPMIATPDFSVDMDHQDLPGPDPRYTSWKNCKPGDYLISTLKFHTKEGDGTGIEMDSLYAVDSDGVLVLTQTRLDYKTPQPVSYWNGRFRYYSAKVMNPAQQALGSGLSSGADVASPVPGARLPSVKTYTVNHWENLGDSLGVWASPEIPNLLVMSVRKNTDDVWVSTLSAVHCSNGVAWSDGTTVPDMDVMLDVAQPDGGPKLISFTRFGDGWVGQLDTGLRSDNPVTEVKNVSFSLSRVRPPSIEIDGRESDVVFTMMYSAETMRTLKNKHWGAWHAVHLHTDASSIEQLDYALKDHVWKEITGATHSMSGAPTFRPPGNIHVDPRQMAAALASPDAPALTDAQKDGQETDHWGNLAAGKSGGAQDKYLASHLTMALPKPARMAKFNAKNFGCTFSYDLTFPVKSVWKSDAKLEKEFNVVEEPLNVSARPIEPDAEAPTLDGEYQHAVSAHKNDTSMVASNPAKVKISGVDGVAFTIDTRDKDQNEIRSFEIFAIKPHRTLKITCTVYAPRAEETWIEIRRIMDSMKLDD